MMFIKLINLLIVFVTFIFPLIVAVACFTLVERKFLSLTQRRRGPNVVGFFGLLQPIVDGIKLLFLKETIIPYRANKFLFLLSPVLMFLVSIFTWLCLPFGPGSALLNLDVSILYFLAVSSLGVYGIIISGWSSNSNYALLGALRSTAQMISYEICLSIIIMPVVMLSGSMNLSDIVLSQTFGWHCFILFPSFIMLLISGLAETNRTPFDLPEAEAELVSGYNVEYSAFTFALFFLAEYSNIILMSSFVTVCFLGGWLPIPVFNCCGLFFFVLKIFCLTLFFVLSRATLPRYRFDQLLLIGWKNLLPLSLGFFLFVSSLFYIAGVEMPEKIVVLNERSIFNNN